ncbi:hypothetical protein T4E_11796 [Trichinella pseudospiralis]|nr:hypothetical protein T4E_11796 [Trichinella pseudospiralis]
MIGENEQTATKLLLDSNGIEDQCRGTYSAGCVRVAYGATLVIVLECYLMHYEGCVPWIMVDTFDRH